MANKKKFRPGLVRTLPGFADPGEDLERLLCAAEEFLRLTITVHDRTGILVSPQGRSLLHPRRGSHRHAYCRLGRLPNSAYDRNCYEHCQGFVNGTLVQRPQPFLHRCWKGAVEIAVPIERKGRHLATLFCGPVRLPDAGALPGVPGLPAEVQAAHAALPLWEPARLEAAGRVLEALGQGVLARLEESLAQDAVRGGQTEREVEIRRFLRYHAHEPIGLEDLAAAIHLSPSRASHLVSERFGLPFKELLIEERLRRAKSLLESSALPIGLIGVRVGLANPYYFSRLFRQRVGLTPGAYRARHQPALPRLREG